MSRRATRANWLDDASDISDTSNASGDEQVAPTQRRHVRWADPSRITELAGTPHAQALVPRCAGSQSLRPQGQARPIHPAVQAPPTAGTTWQDMVVVLHEHMAQYTIERSLALFLTVLTADQLITALIFVSRCASEQPDVQFDTDDLTVMCVTVGAWVFSMLLLNIGSPDPAFWKVYLQDILIFSCQQFIFWGVEECCGYAWAMACRRFWPVRRKKHSPVNHNILLRIVDLICSLMSAGSSVLYVLLWLGSMVLTKWWTWYPIWQILYSIANYWKNVI